MRKLILILLAFLAVVTYIRALDTDDSDIIHEEIPMEISM